MVNIQFCGIMAVWIIIIGLPNIIIGGLSIGYGGTNFNIDCDDEAILSLPLWLIIAGSIQIIFSIIRIYAQYRYLEDLDPETRKPIHKKITYMGFGYSSILIIWNIWGAVSLFKYGTNCRYNEESIWIMVLVELIFQWLSMLTLILDAISNIYIIRKNDY